MKFYETNLAESHPGRRYAYTVRELEGRLYLFDRDLPFLKAYTNVYCSGDLADHMDELAVADPMDGKAVSCHAMEYARLERAGIRVHRIRELGSEYGIRVQDEDFFAPDDHRYLTYSVFKQGQKVAEGIVCVEPDRDALLLAEKKLAENLEEILRLPLADRLPEPLRSLVFAQAMTDSGMLFIGNDEDFAGDWTARKLEKLCLQIDRYGLNTYIEAPADPGDVSGIEEGEPVVTAYCGLATKFNFI